MFSIQVHSQEKIKKMLTMTEVIEAVEKVYVLKSEGKTTLLPIITHDFEPSVSDFDIKSGCMEEIGIYGMKVVSYFANNAKIGLPNLIGLLTIYDSTTGAPIGILDATHITCMRTGAAGAIGVKYLARKNSKNALIIGAGKQAVFQIAALLTVKDDIKELAIYDVNSEASEKLVNEIRTILQDEFNIDTDDSLNMTQVKDLESTTRNSDIIITCTPSRAAIIKADWVAEGTHLSCVGSDMKGKQEIDEQIMNGAVIVTDDTTQCLNVGEIEKAYLSSIITPQDIQGEMGELIAKKIKGRVNESDVTVFDTTGIALQDLVTAKIVLDKAKSLGDTVAIEI